MVRCRLKIVLPFIPFCISFCVIIDFSIKLFVKLLHEILVGGNIVRCRFIHNYHFLGSFLNLLLLSKLRPDGLAGALKTWLSWFNSPLLLKQLFKISDVHHNLIKLAKSHHITLSNLLAQIKIIVYSAIIFDLLVIICYIGLNSFILLCHINQLN